MILRNGPLTKISSMRGESNHRIVKAGGSNNHQNISKAVTTRIQLGKMKLTSKKCQDYYVTFGKKLFSKVVEIPLYILLAIISLMMSSTKLIQLLF